MRLALELVGWISWVELLKSSDEVWPGEDSGVNISDAEHVRLRDNVASICFVPARRCRSREWR
jgi:hypothetical protein